jgi:ribonuclease J
MPRWGKLGIPEDCVAVVENGTPIELTPYSMTVLDRLPGGYVFVDGTGVGDIGWSEVRDRDRLAQAGYFFAVVGINSRGEQVGRPYLSTHGFVNEKESADLLKGVEDVIANTLHNAQKDGRKVTSGQLEQALNRYLYDETRKRPVIEVVVRE